MAEQWVETVDRNPDFDSWRYGRSELAALVRAIQADALRHAAEIVQNKPADLLHCDSHVSGQVWADGQAMKLILSVATQLESNS